MKILERGKVPKVPTKWRIGCPNCKSKLEVTRADVRRVNEMWPLDPGTQVITCPVCKIDMSVENHEGLRS